MTAVGQPEASEYAPFYETYVKLVSGTEILQTLEEQQATVRRVVAKVPAARAGFRYAEGKWSIREVIGHCTDAERVFGYRALAFARGEKAPLPSFDENQYARTAGHDGIALAELVDEFGAVRAANLHLLRRFPAEAWGRTGVASGKPVSVRAIAFIMAGHVAHHLAILHDRYGVPAGA